MKMLLTVWLLWMSVLDCKSCSVPKCLLGIGSGAVLVLCIGDMVGEWGNAMSLRETAVAFVMGMLPGIGLLLVAYMTKAVGYGDGVVLMVLGIAVGAQKAVLILAASLFLAAICSVILLLFRKVRRNSNLPFLPFLTVGWFLVGVMG